MKNIKITLEYDGTNYSGWQWQKDTNDTIQQVLEDCLSKLNKSKVRVTGAGRTDAGVHAENQVANFRLNVPIPLNNIPTAINTILPSDIRCKNAEKVSNEFHARYDATGKKYRYRILNQSFLPVFKRNYVYNIYRKINFADIDKALKYFVGEHDFAAFMASGSDVDNTIRIIKDINLCRNGDEYRIEITGNGFLYKMVRIIVGTLIEIGLGKKRVEDVPSILQEKSRIEAGFTAPAKGLTMVKVYY